MTFVTYYILFIYFIIKLINRYIIISYLEYLLNIILRIGIGIIILK